MMVCLILQPALNNVSTIYIIIIIANNTTLNINLPIFQIINNTLPGLKHQNSEILTQIIKSLINLKHVIIYPTGFYVYKLVSNPSKSPNDETKK